MKERYLRDLHLKSTPALSTGVVVAGAGVAGLRAALAAADSGVEVVLITKETLEDTNTFEAQGGIAVVLREDDSTGSQVQDTLKAGAGLCDEAAVRVVVEEGVGAVEEIIRWGAQFDREGGRLAFGREAAHSVNRVIHAAGDQTGREVSRTLEKRARANPLVTVLEHVFAVDLLHHEGGVWGLVALDAEKKGLVLHGRSVVLATGGIGQVYRETTNPEVATGDGIALAARAGAVLEDMEFVQFHPTTFYLAGAKRQLISEAVRGEGAYLLNTRRERFMPDYDPQAELASRDVVSRAILEEMRKTESPHVYLDLRHLDAGKVRTRFPLMVRTCAAYDLDVTRDLIPVRPAAHYFMGGVRTDLEGRTSVDRLFACGECACIGLHGANRLASNSLLEGLVMGKRAGAAAAAEGGPGAFPLKSIEGSYPDQDVPIDVHDMVESVEALMWRQVGMLRRGEDLASAGRALRHWRRNAFRRRFAERNGLELQNMLQVASFIAQAAEMREESRGAHFRTDFPERDNAWLKHISLSLDDLNSG